MTGSPAAEGRYALVVATARYTDPKLAQLRAPAADAERLGAVLGDAERGDFDVQVIVDDTHARVTRAIAGFFRDRRPQDLLLLHFSCHGVKDERGELYLAATDTEVDLLSATGVSAAWLSEQIDRSRSRRTVVLLDCCFSGSFPFGMRPRGGGVDAPEQLQGRGRVIITASNAMEYAYEGDRLVEGEAAPSVFTGAIIDGLETGDADLDGDRWISVDDLYDYVYDRVREATPGQRPLKKSELEGPLYLARSVRVPEPVAPPPEPAPAPPPERAARRGRLLIAAAALVAVIAAAVVFLLLPGGGGVIPAGNLVTNPSFEPNDAGWIPDNSEITVEQKPDAPDGANVARVTWGGDPTSSYSIDDKSDTIPSTVKGETYGLAAFVRATPSTDGRHACIAVREKTPSRDQVASDSAGAVMTADRYVPIRLDWVARGSGHIIDVHVFSDGDGRPLAQGDAFLVDAITITPGIHQKRSGSCPF